MCKNKKTLQAEDQQQEAGAPTKCGRTREDFELCEMLLLGYLGRLHVVACDNGMIGEFLPLEAWHEIACECGLKASYGSCDSEIFVDDVFDVLTEWDEGYVRFGDCIFYPLPLTNEKMLFGFVNIADEIVITGNEKISVFKVVKSEEKEGMESSEENANDQD